MDTQSDAGAELRREAGLKLFVRFECVAPEAEAVFLVGDFNDWNPSTHPMVRQDGGRWLLEAAVTPGQGRYQFLVDGSPSLDPKAPVRMSAWNGRVSNLDFS